MAAQPRSSFRVLLYGALVLLMLFLALQLARPELKNPPVTAELQAPAEVKQILRKSCYNCHSNETKLLWFDNVVPAYWLVASDVKQARAHLNFSDIGAKPLGQQKGVLFAAVNKIQLGAMPLPSYLQAHPEAVVTDAELAVLRAYLTPATQTAATPTDVSAADAQYEQWSKGDHKPPSVQPAPNGIEFLPEYKNWKEISSTDRFDNGTIRAILGNDIAVNAIARNDINPWPDGTTFAKVAWSQQPDGKGVVRMGPFLQVEFMIKDSRKYAATKGWGWARWRGTDLKPYGTAPDFSNECVECHTPLRENDYVFTMPIKAQQGGGR